MRQIVLLQCIATLAVAVIASLFGGVSAWWSALLGGICCILPNAVFAWRLSRVSRLSSSASPMTFFYGEFLKIVMTFALISVSVKLYHNLHGVTFVIGFIVALKSYLILLFRNRL